MGKTQRKSDIDQAMGLTLKQLRQDKGMTQSQAASYLSTNQATLSNYENGVTSVSPTTMYAAMHVYETDPGQFFATVEQVAKDTFKATPDQMIKARGVLNPKERKK